jgi:hypothetical protein
VRLLTKTGNLTKAAKQAGVSSERLRGFALRNEVVRRSGRGWKEVRREVLVTTQAKRRWIKVGFETSSLVGAHNEAIKRARRTNHPGVLAPFEGKSAVDLKGRQYPLETRINVLHRLAYAGSERFENVYRLTV